MLHTVEEEHKTSQPDEYIHLHKPYLHNNIPIDFSIPMGILPFLLSLILMIWIQLHVKFMFLTLVRIYNNLMRIKIRKRVVFQKME